MLIIVLYELISSFHIFIAILHGICVYDWHLKRLNRDLGVKVVHIDESTYPHMNANLASLASLNLSAFLTVIMHVSGDK